MIRSDPQTNRPLHRSSVFFWANKPSIFHHQQVLLCLVTVIFPLACVCLASCKRHVVQVGREYLLEPSPCARSTPAMASKRLKLKAVNDCWERRSFAQRFMVMKENLKDHFNWKKCFFCKKSQAATCCVHCDHTNFLSLCIRETRSGT